MPVTKVMVKTSGVDKIVQRLTQKIPQVSNASKKGMHMALLKFEGDSIREVPVVTGNLKGSRFRYIYTILTKHTGVLGYGASYAVYVHEHPNAGKPKVIWRRRRTGEKYKRGKKKGKAKWGPRYRVGSSVGNWKFLEGPLKRNRHIYLRIIARYSKRGVEK